MTEVCAKLEIMLLRSYRPLCQRVFRPAALRLAESPIYKVEVDCPNILKQYPNYLYKDILGMAEHHREELSTSKRPKSKPIVSVRRHFRDPRLTKEAYR